MAVWDMYRFLRGCAKANRNSIFMGKKKKKTPCFWNLLFTDNQPWFEF